MMALRCCGGDHRHFVMSQDNCPPNMKNAKFSVVTKMLGSARPPSHTLLEVAGAPDVGSRLVVDALRIRASNTSASTILESQRAGEFRMAAHELVVPQHVVRQRVHAALPHVVGAPHPARSHALPQQRVLARRTFQERLRQRRQRRVGLRRQGRDHRQAGDGGAQRRRVGQAPVRGGPQAARRCEVCRAHSISVRRFQWKRRAETERALSRCKSGSHLDSSGARSPKAARQRRRPGTAATSPSTARCPPARG